MDIRKWIRILHRDIGYIFFGMCIIYGLSGIALNHIDDWNPDYTISHKRFFLNNIPEKDRIDKGSILSLISELSLDVTYRSHYFPQPDTLKIFLKEGSMTIDLTSGVTLLEQVKKRPVFREVNFLHYNKPKKLWTWFSDLFAVSLIFLATTGLFMIQGKKGITGRGAWLAILGIIIPLIFLIIYLWFY
jgi:uncharacterized protein